MGTRERSGERGDVSISEASERLGVPAPTIRSWERRFHFPSPPRTRGGHRRYTAEDLRRLRIVRDETTRGRPVRDAVEIAARADAGGDAGAFVERIIRAAEALDQAGVTGALQDGTSAWGIEICIRDVVFPAMHRIGREWEAGACDVANEHSATEAVQAWLTGLRSSAVTAEGFSTALLSCGPKDTHVVGLHALAAILSGRGVRTEVLGALTPTDSLRLAFRALRPGAVVLLSHMAINRKAALESLRGLAQETRGRLFFAGGAFLSSTSRKGVPGKYLGEDVILAADRIGSVLVPAEVVEVP